MYGDLFLELWKRKNPQTVIRYRDLAKEPIPHLTQQGVESFLHGAGEGEALELSDRLCRELIASDILLLVCPTYNFGVPSAMKAYIDHVVRSRITFAFDPRSGYRGLLTGKRAYLISCMGDQRTQGHKLEPFEAYLHRVLHFIGIQDIETIPIYGTSDPEFFQGQKKHFTDRIKQLL